MVKADGTERICNMDYMMREGHVQNYAADLNSQFEAWQKLTEEQKLMFGNSVDRIALRDGIRKEEAQYRFGCECLLRALGKWIE